MYSKSPSPVLFSLNQSILCYSLLFFSFLFLSFLHFSGKNEKKNKTNKRKRKKNEKMNNTFQRAKNIRLNCTNNSGNFLFSVSLFPFCDLKKRKCFEKSKKVKKDVRKRRSRNWKKEKFEEEKITSKKWKNPFFSFQFANKLKWKREKEMKEILHWSMARSITRYP